MNIAIFGAGTVGSSVAEALAGEQNDVTLIDRDDERLRWNRDRLDIKTVCGDASDPETLEQADIEDADIVLAVTNRDDTNILTCQLANTIYNTPKKFARLRSENILKHEEELFGPGSIFPIDAVISPEHLITKQIMQLIEHPGALQVVDFADGKIQLAAIRANPGGNLVGHEIQDIRKYIPNIDTRVAAIYRQNQGIIPRRDTVIEVNDEIFLIAAREHIETVVKEFGKLDGPTYGKRVMLVGGGNIGMRLARELEPSGFRVKLVEISRDNAVRASDELSETIVIHGDASDQELMLRENIEHTEVYCAVTNDDEANILSSMMAKKLGARRTMALITNSAYADLLENTGIDIVINPSLVTISELLRHMRRGDIHALHSLRRGAAEAIETIVHGDPSTSKVVGRAIADLDIPPEATIGAILRGEDVLIARRDIVVQSKDHVILFVVDKGRKQINQVEKLFEPDVRWI